MSTLAILLLLAAVILLVAAEWGRVDSFRAGRVSRDRARRKSRLRVVDDGDDDDFARSVERDLAALPTIDEHDAKKR